VSLETLCLSRLLLPASRDSLPLSVELDGSLSVEVRGTPHAVLVTREREHREGHRDRKVDTNLTGFDLSLELTCDVTVLGEDRSSISPSVVVDEIDGVLGSVNAYNLHDRSKDLFFIAVNASAHMVDNGWSDPVSIRIALNLDATAIEKEFAVLLAVGN